MPYKTLTSEIPWKLDQMVSVHIKDGWKPVGGCQRIVTSSNIFGFETYLYFQMVQKDE